jgi:hypothetical protein
LTNIFACSFLFLQSYFLHFKCWGDYE